MAPLNVNDAIPLHLVYCKSATLLTRRPYGDWREIQEEYDDYMASLGPWSAAELIDYFRDEYGEESEWPFTQGQIEAFPAAGVETLRSG